MYAEVARMISPRASRHANAEDANEDLNEEAEEQSSPSRHTVANRDKITHLGSNLPDVPDDSWPVSSPPQAESLPPPDMGANQSREELNAMFLNASRKSREAGAGSGKLPKDPKGRFQPKNGTAGSTQRPLTRSEAPRASVYDLPHEPIEPSSAVARLHARELVKRGQQNAQFSPIRKQRKDGATRRGQQLDASAGAQEGEDDNIAVVEADNEASKPGKKRRGRPPNQSNRAARKANAQARSEEEPASTAVEKHSAPTDTRRTQRQTRHARDTVPSAQDEMSRNTNAEVDGEVATAEDDHLFVVQSSDEEDSSQPQALRADKVRPSELYARDASDLTSKNNPSPQEQAARPTAGNKRKRSSAEDGQANTGRKRAKFSYNGQSLVNVAGEGEDGNVQQDPGSNALKLHGQWTTLEQIHRNLRRVGRNVIRGKLQSQNQIALIDLQVKATVALCGKAKTCFSKLCDDPSSVGPDVDPAGVLGEIGERVDGLRNHNEEYPTDFENRDKVTNIYSHLIPALVRLITHAAQSYLSMDEGKAEPGQITLGHLRIVQSMIQMILDLEDTAAKNYKKRPYPSLCVIQPVHNGIAIPLRIVNQVFLRQIDNDEDEERMRKWHEAVAEDRESRRIQNEMRSKREAQSRAVKDKWHQLHHERLRAEGGFIRPPKMAHLQLPLSTESELDGEGNFFSRQPGFVLRIGPPPSRIQRAAMEIWSQAEIQALYEGLQQYTGPLVIEKIFRRYCGKGRELHRFNVTEIVTTAAMLKERLVEAQTSREGVVEQWVKDIPVWTKNNLQLEEENKENDNKIAVLEDER